MKKAVLLFFVLIAGLTFGQVDRSKMPEPGPAPEIQLGDVETFTLDNGLKVFVVENHKLPRVSFSLQVDRDPIVEGDKAGYVTCAGDLLRRGTTSRTQDEINEEVDFLGARLSTSPTTVFASSLKEHSEKLMDIFADIVKNADFRQEELEKIKVQLLSGIEAEKDDPNAIAGNVRRAVVYGKDHPYGEQTTKETVESITLEDCKDYYKTYFRPNVSYLAIVGDINKDEAEDLVKKYLGDWEKADVPSHEYEDPKTPLVRKIALVDRPASVQSVIYYTWPLEYHTGEEGAIAGEVMNSIFGGSFSARLNQNLREDKGWTYGARSSLAPDEVIGTFYASTEARTAVTDSVVKEMEDELKKMINEPVTDEELNLVKNYMTGEFSRALERPETMARFAINIDRYDLPQDYYQNYLKNLNAVTTEEIQAAAKQYLKPENAYVVIVGNADQVADNLKKFATSGKVDYYDIKGNKTDAPAKNVPADVTVGQVIDQHINAMGGRENLEKIEDVTMKMKGNTMGVDVNLTMYRKAPNYFKQVLEAGAMQQVTAFNGETGGMSAMGQTMELEGENLKELKMQSTMNLYLKLEELGIEPKLAAVENLDGKEVYKIDLKMPWGSTWYHYIDKETGYKVREVMSVESPQGPITQTINYSDFREINGVFYPYSLTQVVGPQSISMSVESVKVNTGLEESFFSYK